MVSEDFASGKTDENTREYHPASSSTKDLLYYNKHPKQKSKQSKAID